MKANYYSIISSNLINPSTSPEASFPNLNSLMNNKKIPYIPPLFHENKFITDCRL